MKVAIGADHAGFELKGEIVRWLKSEGHQVNDTGAHNYDPDDDYPDFAAAVANSLNSLSTGTSPQPWQTPCAQGIRREASSSAAAESAPASRPTR